MCILIAKPAGAVVDIDTLSNCWDACSDGAGIAYAMEGKLIVEKGFMDWNAFKDFIIDPDEWKDIPMLIHFRFTTKGDTNIENTHPFEVIPNKLAFAHNGTMHEYKSADRPDLSDTNVFCRYVLKQLPHNFLNNQGIDHLLFNAIGKTSKLAFLDREGNITIYNEQLGVYEGEAWFSNTKHRPKPETVYHSWSWAPGTKPRSPLPATVRTVQPSLESDDWYCGECAMWFSEGECDPITFGDDKLTCPMCGTMDSVSFDPLNFDELGDDDTHDSDTEFIGGDAAVPW